MLSLLLHLTCPYLVSLMGDTYMLSLLLYLTCPYPVPLMGAISVQESVTDGWVHFLNTLGG